MPEEYVAFSSVFAYEQRFREIHEQDAILVHVDLLGYAYLSRALTLTPKLERIM
jgi:hypothetical protein